MLILNRKKRCLLSLLYKFRVKVRAEKLETFYEKKRIYVLYCRGGGGHVSAAKAVKSCLDNKYHVKEVCLHEEVTYKLDLLRTLTFNYFNFEDLYTFFISYNILMGIHWLFQRLLRQNPSSPHAA